MSFAGAVLTGDKGDAVPELQFAELQEEFDTDCSAETLCVALLLSLLCCRHSYRAFHYFDISIQWPFSYEYK